MEPWDEFSASDNARPGQALAEPPEPKPWQAYQTAPEGGSAGVPARFARDTSGNATLAPWQQFAAPEPGPWDQYAGVKPELSPEDQAKVDKLKAGIADWQESAHYYDVKQAELGNIAAAIDLPGALHAAFQLPGRLALAYQKWRGLVPPETPYQPMPPIVSPDQVALIRQWAGDLNPGYDENQAYPPLLKNDANQFKQGLAEGFDQFASGLTDPELIFQALAAKRFPAAMPRLWQAETLGQIPASAQAVIEARNPRERGAALVGAAANVAVPAVIEHGLQPGKTAPTILNWTRDDSAPGGWRVQEQPATGPPSEFGGDTTPRPSAAPVQTSEPPPTPAAPSPGGEGRGEGGQPLSTTEQKYLAEDIANRTPIPAATVARAGIEASLPEGYALEGDTWRYTEPEAKLTPEQLQHREATAASEALAAEREGARPSPAALTEPEPAAPADEQSDNPQLTDSQLTDSPLPPGERPPDILDDLEGHYPGGISPTRRADYGEHVTRWQSLTKGADKKYLRHTGGERADQVLKELHDEGLYPRIETEDQLLQAMGDAAEARQGWKEQQTKVEAWLDRAIEATAPYTGDPFEGVTGAPVWMTKSLAHGTLLATREAIRLGRSVARAIEAGVKWLREQNHPAFHESEARLWLTRAEASEWLKNLPPNPKLEQGIPQFKGEFIPLDKAMAKAEREASEKPGAEVQRRQQPGDHAGRQSAPERGAAQPAPARAPRPAKSKLPPAPEETRPAFQEIDRQIQAAEERANRYGDELTISASNLRSGNLDPRDIHNAVEAGMARQNSYGLQELRRYMEKPEETPSLAEIDRRMAAATEQANLHGDMLPKWNLRHGNMNPTDLSHAVQAAMARQQTYNLETLRNYVESHPPKGQLELWADRTIAEGQKRLHAGLDPELLAAYAVKGATVIARGVRDFATWSTEMLREFGEAIRPHLQAVYRLATDQPGLRQAVAKIQVSDASDAVKAATLADFDYPIRTHQMLDQQAEAIVQRIGPDNAFDLYKQSMSAGPRASSPALPLDLSERLKQNLLNRARQDELTFKGSDPAKEQAAQQRQVDLWQADVYGTETAQGLAARNTNTDMSAGAHLRQARDLFGQAGAKTAEELDPHMGTIAGELRAGHVQALDELKADPAANTAARQAVNQHILDSPETHRAVVMELAGPWSQSTHILNQAREAVRAKAHELLNVAPRPPGLSPSQHLRQILDDLAARAAGIAAHHFQGVEPETTLTAKLQQRLGLTQEKASALAKRLEAEFTRQVKLAGEQLPRRIARQRIAQGKGLPETASDPVVDQAIRGQLRTLNQKLGDLVAQTKTTVETTGRTVGERILKDSGLTGPAAERLRTTIDRRYEDLANAAKRRRLDALVRGPAPPPRALRRQFERLLQWTRLGAFDDARLRDHILQGLGLRTLTPEISREIVRRANDIDRMPEGFLRDRASTELLNWITRQAGVKLADIPMGMFYSNILSGLTTAIKIPFENANLLAGQTVIGLLRGQFGWNPLDAARSILAASGRGAGKGALQGAEIMRSGIVTGIKPGVRASSVMELKPFGEHRDWFNYWKWVGREISALHVSTFKPAWEIKQQMIAQRLASEEGLSGQAASRRALELMSGTDAQVAAAQAQAAGELRTLGNTSKLDYRRRVQEIIEQNREATMPGSTEVARDFALRTTYLNQPYGFLGFIAEGVRSIIEQGRQRFPILGRGVKSQIPFTVVVANILNEKLNWTPAGAVRAAIGQRTGELYGRPIMEPGEVGDLYAKSILGSILVGALGSLASQYINGAGPASPQARHQLQQTGWQPNTIGPLNGRYYSYVNTPAAAALSWIGNWSDYHRYGKGETDDAETRAAYAMKGMADVVVQQGMLDGLRRIFDALGDPNQAAGGAKMEKSLARTAGSFVTPNLLMQLDKIFDPQIYDQTGIKAALLSQVPVVRSQGRPVLNALGEPVEAGPFDRWTHAATKDPLWRAIAAQQAWVPEARKDVIIGDRAKGPDYFRILNPDEYYQYVRESGQAIREKLDPAKIVALEPAQTRAYVRKVAEEERHKALRRFRF